MPYRQDQHQPATGIRLRLVSPGMTGLVIGAFALAAGIIAVVTGEVINSGPTLGADVLSELVTEVPGWQVVSLSLGDSPEQTKVIEETLRCDRAINLQYTLDDFRVSIYAAYWRPGKIPVHMVARHTPDICWVAAGWRPIERTPLPSLSSAGDDSDSPVERRIFSNGGIIEHVVFFHVIDGEVSSLAQTDEALGPLLGWASNLFRYEFLFWHIDRDRRGTRGHPPVSVRAERDSRLASLFRQRREQMFVRISSNRPLAEFWPTPVVTGFIQQLRIGTAPELIPGPTNP